MTDKQIIKLKPMEDLNETIIKEKGNTKCIFYADDICRNGDKTRDCINCARVEYHSLYSLNWDNQERLQKIIKHKEQECEELKNFHINLVGVKECEIKELLKLKQTLAEIKKLVEKEFCRHPECCEFCAISNDCINQKIIEKINEVKDE